MRICQVLAFLAGAPLSYASAPPQQTEPTCYGPTCGADLVHFELPGWRIIPVVVDDGQGKGDPLPCDDCKKCRATFIWQYTGGCTWSITYGEDISSGPSPGTGTKTLKIHCD